MKLRNKTYIITLMTAFTLFGGISQMTVNANEKEISTITMEEAINSIDSFETTTTNVNSSEQIKQSKSRLKLTQLNISQTGDVKSQIIMDTNEKLELNGKLLKSDDKKTYYGEIKTNKLNYEVIHFSITRPGEETPIYKNVYNTPVLNIYIKDIISDKINFYELEIKNNALTILDKTG